MERSLEGALRDLTQGIPGGNDAHPTGTGELDNGFRYAIRENGRPENRAELRLVVLAGSVDEDEERDLQEKLRGLGYL